MLPACGNVGNDLNDTANNNYSEDSGTYGNVHDTGPFRLDSDSATEVDDSATTSAAVDSGGCIPESLSCDGNMLMRCINGAWQQYDDCAFYGKKCTVLQGEFQCVSTTSGADTASDSDFDSDAGAHSTGGSDAGMWTDSESGVTTVDDTDTIIASSDTGRGTDVAVDTNTELIEFGECDGPNVDCYTDCWLCALNSATCRPVLEECMLDVSCASLYDCTDQVCCGGNDNCLTGDDWKECFSSCAEDANASDNTMAIYSAIDKCVACDACAISCGENESADFAMCVDASGINTPGNPCYEEDAEDGETACFSWAGWGGPCSTAVTNCKNDDACGDLDSCINDTWQYDDWSARQDVCFEDAGPAAEALYWAYMQCIYCDACDVACLRDAGAKRCDEYTGSIVDPDSDTGANTGTDTGIDTGEADNTCKYQCADHCMAIGGTVMEGICPADEKCCDMGN